MKNKHIVAAAGAVAIVAGFILLKGVNSASSVTPETVSRVKKSDSGQSLQPAIVAETQPILTASAGATSTKDQKNDYRDRVEKFSQVTKSFGFSVDIILLAKQHPELGLTPAQIEQVQRLYNDAHLERLELEATLARVAAIENDKIKIVIPAYPTEGKAIKDAFYQNVAQSLGQDIASKVQDTFSRQIDASMRSFGANAQLISAVPEKSGVLDIAHTTVNADGVVKIVNSRLTKTNLDQYTILADLLTPGKP